MHIQRYLHCKYTHWLSWSRRYILSLK